MVCAASAVIRSVRFGASDALTWPQMKEMIASGVIEIQPHSKTHANLTQRLPDESEARYRERIRREVGRERVGQAEARGQYGGLPRATRCRG